MNKILINLIFFTAAFTNISLAQEPYFSECVDLKVTPSDSSINLTWSPNFGMQDFSMYEVSMQTTSEAFGDNFSLVGSTNNLFSNSFQVSGLTIGQTYYFRVSVIDTNAQVDCRSNVVSAYFSGSNVQPPLNFKVFNFLNSGDLSFRWNKGGSEVAKYRILADTFPQPITAYDSTLSFNDTFRIINNFDTTKNYFFRVQAIDTSGAIVGYSEEVIHKPGFFIQPFSTNIYPQFQNGNLSISWSKNTKLSGFKRYLIYRGFNPSLLSPYYYTSYGNRSDTTFNLIQVPNNTTVYYSVAALNYANNATNQDSIIAINFTDTFPPSIPQGFLATPGDQSAFLKWNQSVDQHGNFFKYNIYGDTINPPSQLIGTTNNILDTSYNITGLINGITYYYAVTAEDDYNNESGFSSIDSITPADTTGPLPVSNFDVAIDSEKVSMTWLATPNLDGDFFAYQISRGSSFQNMLPIDTLYNLFVNGYVDNDVNNNTTYYYRVDALDSSLNKSTESPKFFIRPTNVESEPNNFFFSANLLDSAKVAQIRNSNDIDYFRFEITQATQVQIKTQPVSVLDTLVGDNILDTYLTLYDSTGNNQIAFNNNDPNNPNYSRIVQFLSNPGVYYIEVDGNLASDIGYYSIQIEKLQADIYEPNNSIFTANFINQDSISVSDISIFPVGDIDVFGFNSDKSYKAQVNYFNPFYTGTIRFIDSLNQIIQTVVSNQATFIVPDSADYYISYQVPGFSVPNYSLDFKLIPPVSYADSFQISEVNYKDGEFIEIYNLHNSSINVSRFSIQELNFQFPNGTFIPSNEYFVVAKDSIEFFNVYGFYPDLSWGTDTLLHNNQSITFSDTANSLVDLLIYDVNSGFPVISSGEQKTIELTQPELDNNIPSNWQSSHIIGGTPGHFSSVPRVYNVDDFQPNDSLEQAYNIDFVDSLTISLAEIEDSVDWFLWRPRAYDTLHLSFPKVDTTLSALVTVYNKNKTVWYEDTLEMNYSKVLVPQVEDSIYLQVKVLDDNEQFIINEGFAEVKISTKQFIYQSPFLEDFERDVHPNLPPGIQTFDLDSNGASWQISSLTIGLGNSQGLELNQNPNGNNDWLILPPFYVRKDDSFGFVAMASSQNFPEKVEVWMGSKDAKVPSDFTTFIDSVTFDSIGFQQYYYDLSAYEKQTIRMAIKGASINQNQLYLDNISLSPPVFNASIRGIVTDNFSGLPIKGVEVDDGEKSVFSDSLGYYEINEVKFGNIPIEFSKPGYTKAINTFSLQFGDTVNFNPSLVKNLIDTFYLNTFDNNTTQGYSNIISGSRNWLATDTIIFGGQTYTPIQGDSMLVFGSSIGYGINQSVLYNFLNSGSFDLSQYEKVDLYYSVNHDIDSTDGAFLIANFNQLVDINDDLVTDSNDIYTGNSNGWFRDSVSLSSFTNFSNFDLSFLFQSGTYFNTGFGIAIDSIIMIAEREVKKPAPYNLKAQSFLIDTVNLTWSIDTTNVSSYKIFRSSLNSSYSLIATTPDTFFVDTNVQNGSLYNYYIVANYPYGESEPSGNALATPGIPATKAIPYFENFNANLSDTLPHLWGYDISLENPWFVGDTLLAQAFNNQFSFSNRFLFANFFSIGIIGEYYETMLTTPWFDFSNISNPLILRFSQQSAPVEETHELVYRDGLGSDWMVLDTLDGNWEIRNYFYNITSLAQGKPYFQFAFRVRNDSNFLNTPIIGMGIDNFRVREEKTGIIEGIVSSETGSPIPNTIVELNVQNEQLWDEPKTYLLVTDSNGFFQNSTAQPIYNNVPYEIKTGLWSHDSAIVQNLQLFGADTLVENLTLQLQLNPPEIIQTETDSLGFPVISWSPPAKVGEISYDNGQFFSSDSLIPGSSAGALFISDAPTPFKVNQLAIFGQGDTTYNHITLRAYKVLPNSLPDLNDTIFEVSGITLDTNMLKWQFVDVNKLVDTSHFYLTLTGEAGPVSKAPKIGYQKNISNTISIQQNNQSQSFFNSAQGLLMRAYIEIGNTNFNYSSTDFPGTYSIYNVSNVANSINLLDTNLSNTSFKDTTINIGDTALYFVRATGTYGLSPISNIFPFVMQGLPFASISNLNLDLNLNYTTPVSSNSFLLKNSGLDTLDFSISYHAGIAEGYVVDTPSSLVQDIDGSMLYCFDNPSPGDSLTLHFYLENRNLIGDNHEQVEVFFPKGVNVINSSNLQVYESSRFLLSNGFIGDSVTLSWTDPNANTIGEVYPFEAASFEVDVWIDSSITQPITLDYLIRGDSKKQRIGNIQLQTLPFNASIPTSTNNLSPSSQLSINGIFNNTAPPLFGGRYPSYFEITSNDPNKPIIQLPFLLELEPATGVFNGLVTDDVNNDPIPGAIVTVNGVSDTSDGLGWFAISGVDVGTYSFSATHPNYYDGTTTGTLLAQDDTSTVLITMKPRVQKPINLTAIGSANTIVLDWEVEDFSWFFDMEQPAGAQSFEIEDWKQEDLDGDGIAWDYYGVGPFEGSFCIANTTNNNAQNNDWLISKQVRIEEENAKFKFYASPQDPNFSEERFVVRVSQTGDNVNDFTDSLYSYQFASGVGNWQLFEIPLGSYLGDSIHVAIQCRSTNQFKLKLDAIEFVSAQSVEQPADPGVYDFNIYRSQNNGLFSLYQNITSTNDTVQFVDSTAINDTLYTYFIRSVISSINQVSEQSNFASFRLLSKDIGVSKMLEPTTSRTLTDAEFLRVEIENLGTDSVLPIDTFQVSFSINGQPIIDKQVVPDSSFGPGEHYEVLFDDTLDLSSKGFYDFEIWTSLKRDNNIQNDTLKNTIQHKPDTLLPPSWSVDPFQFQYNMSITAEVFILDTQSVDTNDILAAVVNQQIRGITNIEYIPSFNKYVAQLTVYSNATIENINFMVWDATKDSVYNIIESYTFINNQIYGSLSSPEQLHTISLNELVDVGIEAINSPLPNAVSYGNSEALSIRIRNYGTNDLLQGDTIPVRAQIVRKGVNLVNATENVVLPFNLTPNDTLSYTFNQQLNMTDTGSYFFTFNTDAVTDIDRSNDTLKQQIDNIPRNEPVWSVNPSLFQYSSFLTGRIFFDDIVSQDENDRVAAFVNNQVRGVADVSEVNGFNGFFVQIPIYSNSPSGDIVKFKAYDHSKDEVLNVEEEYLFSNNAVWGSLVNPERLHAVTGYNSVELIEDALSFRIYPNPVSNQLFINWEQQKPIKIQLINTLNQVITETENLAKPQVINTSNLAKGVYVLRVTVTSGVLDFKVIVTH